MVTRGCVIGSERIGAAIELHSTSVEQNRKSRLSSRAVVDRRGIHEKALWWIKRRIFCVVSDRHWDAGRHRVWRRRERGNLDMAQRKSDFRHIKGHSQLFQTLGEF